MYRSLSYLLLSLLGDAKDYLILNRKRCLARHAIQPTCYVGIYVTILYHFVGPNHGGFGGFRDLAGSSEVCASTATRSRI